MFETIKSWAFWKVFEERLIFQIKSLVLRRANPMSFDWFHVQHFSNKYFVYTLLAIPLFLNHSLEHSVLQIALVFLVLNYFVKCHIHYLRAVCFWFLPWFAIINSWFERQAYILQFLFLEGLFPQNDKDKFHPRNWDVSRFSCVPIHDARFHTFVSWMRLRRVAFDEDWTLVLQPGTWMLEAASNQLIVWWELTRRFNFVTAGFVFHK